MRPKPHSPFSRFDSLATLLMNSGYTIIADLNAELVAPAVQAKPARRSTENLAWLIVATHNYHSKAEVIPKLKLGSYSEFLRF